MLECLLSLTKRREKSRTSTRTSFSFSFTINLSFVLWILLKFLHICRKQQQQQMDRGDFSPCGTPTGLDSRDPFDLQVGKLINKYIFHLRLCLSVDGVVTVTWNSHTIARSRIRTWELSYSLRIWDCVFCRGKNVLQYSWYAVEEEVRGTSWFATSARASK